MYQQLLIYILFFFSGISGLIYETVWLRILGRILGNTVYATSIVLAVFMAGMALGSYIIGKYADKLKNPIRLYAIFEICVGLSAFILYFLFDSLIPFYKLIYNLSGGERMVLTFFQLILLFFLLLIPTTLMGGTLPLLTSYTGKFNIFFATRIGNLYGLNTLGAVIGVIGSGLYTIGSLGELFTLCIAIIINFMISLTVLYMDRVYNKQDDIITSTDELKSGIISPYSQSIRNTVLFIYAVNGFTSIAYEVLWTRILQIHLGTSIYSFSMMLGIYLIGIALGSLAAGKFTGRLKDPLSFLGLSQIFVALYSIAGLHIFLLFKSSSSINISHIIFIPFLMIFPVTFVLGMLFPAVSKCYIRDEKNTASGVGFIYSMNTIGGIIGSLICGFIFIKLFGTKNTIIILSGLNITIGLIASFLSYNRIKCIIPVSLCVILAIFLGFTSHDPFLEVIKKNIKQLWPDDYSNMEIYYHKESSGATTTAFGITKVPIARQLWINGTGMTKLCNETKLIAHLPILLHNNPQEMLIVCMGMGTTLHSAMVYKNLKCDVVELIPEVYECYKYYYNDSEKILSDSRVKHYVDDGRNFLLVTNKTYDIITIDPAPPLWSAGTVNLYSKEFFKLCKLKLNKNGIMCLWVPPDYFTEVRMILATFLTVFPNTEVWGGPVYPGFYLVGTENPLQINKDNFVNANKNSDIISDLTEWDKYVPAPEHILNLHIANADQLRPFTDGIPIITDNNPYTEFPLWRLQFDPANKENLDAIYLCKYLSGLKPGNYESVR